MAGRGVRAEKRSFPVSALSVTLVTVKASLCWLLAGISLLGVRDAGAMTVEATDFDRLLDRAEQIFKAQVIAVQCAWSGEGANRHIATFVRLRVLESYRGAAQGEQTLEFLGGTVGDRVEHVAGMPEFQPGDVEILFVRGNHIDLCPLVGIYFGRFRVVQSAADGREQVFLHDGAPLTDLSLVGREPAARTKPAVTDASGAPTRAMSTKEFAAKIRDGLKRRGITPDDA